MAVGASTEYGRPEIPSTVGNLSHCPQDNSTVTPMGSGNKEELGRAPMRAGTVETRVSWLQPLLNPRCFISQGVDRKAVSFLLLLLIILVSTVSQTQLEASQQGVGRVEKKNGKMGWGESAHRESLSYNKFLFYFSILL